MITGIVGLLALGVIFDIPKNFKLESKVATRSGLLERFVDPEDERDFIVQLTKASKKTILLEDYRANPATPGKTIRFQAPSFRGDTSIEFLIAEDEKGTQKVLGEVTKVFDKSESSSPAKTCGALVRVEYPTPLGDPNLYSIADLECADPLTTNGPHRNVLGHHDESQIRCSAEEKSYCLWNYRPESDQAAAVQASVYSFLWRAEGELFISGIETGLPKVNALSWASDANRSEYLADEKTLYYGGGQFLDGLDGFVVVHEWTHFLIDQLNSGLAGFSSQILHEGFADFFASNLFNSSCFAPYDAQEVEGRVCLRELQNTAKFPDDMSSREKHKASLILSGALWEARSLVPAPLMNEILIESIMRIPKVPDLLEYWSLILKIYERFLSERELLKNNLSKLQEIGRRRGLFQ